MARARISQGVQNERRIALLSPRVGWNQSRFERYWLEQHGTLVATTPDYGRYRADYVQDHIVQADLGSEDVPYAGVASVRLPEGGVPNFASTSLFQNRILPDEKRFLSREACLAVRVREHIIRDGYGLIKCIAFGASDAESVADWFRASYELLAADVPLPERSVVGEVLAPPTDLDGTVLPGAPPFNWVEESYFDTLDDAVAHFTARRVRYAALPRWAYISQEHVLFSAGRPTLSSE